MPCNEADRACQISVMVQGMLRCPSQHQRHLRCLLRVTCCAGAAAVACSGIEASCLQEDMASGVQGSKCKPLQHGALCSADGKRCKMGHCVYEGM
jgi:hypothetical protein